MVKRRKTTSQAHIRDAVQHVTIMNVPPSKISNDLPKPMDSFFPHQFMQDLSMSIAIAGECEGTRQALVQKLVRKSKAL